MHFEKKTNTKSCNIETKNELKFYDCYYATINRLLRHRLNQNYNYYIYTCFIAV